MVQSDATIERAQRLQQQGGSSGLADVVGAECLAHSLKGKVLMMMEVGATWFVVVRPDAQSSYLHTASPARWPWCACEILLYTLPGPRRSKVHSRVIACACAHTNVSFGAKNPMAMRALVLVAKSQVGSDGLVAEGLLRTAMSSR